MDLLKKQLLASILSDKTGDSKLDEATENLSRYVIGALNNYQEAVARIEGRRDHFTPAGLFAQKQRARAKAREEVKEAFEKNSLAKDIAEVQERFEDHVDRDPIKALVMELRQQEMRRYLLENQEDIGKMAAFEAKVQAGDPVALGAIDNAPFEVLSVPEETMQAGREKLRLNSNPAAADRLATLEKAHGVVEQLKGFFDAELGGTDGDPIADLAG